MTTQAEALAELLEDLAHVPRMGEWVSHAACRGEAELFSVYPASKTAAARVAAICDRCPVRVTCEDYAGRYDVDGVWAGTWHNTSTGAGQQPLQEAPVRARAECGTYGGYRWHRRHGEAACGPCKAANSAQAALYAKRRES